MKKNLHANWRTQITPALKVIIEDAEKFQKQASSLKAAADLRDWIDRAKGIVELEGQDADQLISIGFWLHQTMLECVGEPGVSNVLTLKWGRTHLKKQIMGGRKGSIRAHGDKNAKYIKMRAALAKYRVENPSVSKTESRNRVAKLNRINGWSVGTLRRADTQ